MKFSEAQVAQLAPDAASLKSGKDYARPGKWLLLAANERLLWGEVQGSGKDPYRTAVDLLGPTAFKCSCPSRKFPCKHGLGILFLHAQSDAAISTAVPEPEWAKEWIEKRQQKAETKTAPPETPSADEKKAAQRAKAAEKTKDQRMALARAGAAEMELLLKDVVRTGLLGLPEKGMFFWEKLAARMVDSKAPGLAVFARNFNKINYFGGNAWHESALANAGKAWLALEGFARLETLPENLQEELRNRIGWSQKRKELLENPALESLADRWLVAGKILSQEDDLNVCRHWLFGLNSGRRALILDFAHRSQSLDTALLPGVVMEATLVFYPSASPERALVKSQENMLEWPGLPAEPSPAAPLDGWLAVQSQFAAALGQNPWAEDLLFFVRDLVAVPQGDAWFLRDAAGYLMPIDAAFSAERRWQLLSVSGGNPLTMFVLRTETAIYPLGIATSKSYFLL